MPSSLPDPSRTPGAIDPTVSQATIGETICRRGWTRSVRPPEAYTYGLKRAQIREYRYRDRRLRDYEEDHLIPLALGGAPRDPRNLWPEPRRPRDGWGSAAKNRLETTLARAVCAGEVGLDTARQAIATDWHEAYRRYVEAGG